jgi:hypothetical protein
VSEPFLDIRDAPAEFRRAALLAAGMDTALRRELGKTLRRDIMPKAVRMYSQAAGTASTGNRLPYALARSAKPTARNGVLTGLRFGSTRSLTGGATLRDLARPIEYGSSNRLYAKYTRRNRGGGGTHNVERRTSGAFAPRREKGRFIGPTTYQHVAPLVVAEWIAAVDRVLEGKVTGRGA